MHRSLIPLFYDALGRRVFCSSRTQGGSYETNYFVYDGAQVVADLNATGGLLRTYVWGPGIDNLLAMTTHGGPGAPRTVFPIKDHLGTVHALVDTNGVMIERYEFDAWGRVLGVYDSSNQQITQSSVGNRYLWQGRATTGSALIRKNSVAWGCRVG